MASKGALVVRFIGDTKDFDRASKSVQNSTSKFGALAGKVGRAAGLGMVALGAGAAAWAGASVKSLARIERINAQTAQAIKSTGGAARVSVKHVEGLSGRLENLTATEAETVQEGANLLLTFTNIQNKVGVGNKIFDRATRSVVDMSRALGQDTSSSAIQLGKALNDPIKGVTALQRVGVSFTQKQKDQIKGFVESGKTMKAQKLILRELTKEFGGSGKAFAATTEGQIELAKHAFGTLGETLTRRLLPALGNLASGATKGLAWADTQVPKVEKFASMVSQKLSPVLSALGGFVRSSVLPAFQSMGDGSSRAGAAMSQFKANFSATFASVSSILQSVGGFLQAFWGRYGDLITKFGIGTLRNFITQLQGFANIITGIFKTIAAVLKGDWSGAWAGIKQIARGAVQVIGAQVSQLWNVMRTVFAAGGRALADLMRAGWSAAVEAVRAGVKAQIRLVASLPGRIVSALGDLSQLLVNAGKAVISGLISGITSKISDLTSKLKSVTNLIPKHKGPESKDRKLLEPAGRAIMDGLLAGIEGRKVQVTKALQKITDLFANVRDRLANLKDIREGFLSTFSADSIFGVDLSEGGGIGALIDFQQKQAQQAAQLMADIQRVASMGLSKSLISQLQAQGTSGAQQLHALAGGSGDQIQLLNSLNAQTQASLQAAGMLAGNTVRGGNIDADISRASREEQLIERIIKRLEKMNDNQMVVIEVDSEVFIKAVKKRNRRHGVATAGM